MRLSKRPTSPFSAAWAAERRQGLRTVSLAKDAEAQGAMGVVLNAPVSNLNLLAVSKAVDIPVIITVIDEATDIGQRIASGASILNVAGGANTPAIVRKIRTEYPDFPIIATGGNKPDTIAATGCGRRKRDYVYAAIRTGTVQSDDDPLSGRVKSA